MNRTARLTLPALALTAGLALSACGASSSGSTMGSMPGMASTASSMRMATSAATAPATTGSSTVSEHNAADTTFVTGMIPHHAQATAMADMAMTSASNAEVKTLAAQIKAGQGPEITMMTGWLQSWGEPVPSTTMSAAMGDMGATMMSSKDMADLGKATGASFDRMWLQMMTKHHQGAITMAKTELDAGRNADVKTLAQNIIVSQSKEITTMATLLTTIG